MLAINKKKHIKDFDSQLEILVNKIENYNRKIDVIKKMQEIDNNFEQYIENYHIPLNLLDEEIDNDTVKKYINFKINKIKNHLKTKNGWDFERFILEKELKVITKEYNKLLKGRIK